MYKGILLSVVFLIGFVSVFAQAVWIEPENPAMDDTVTLYYNAAEGNAALKDYNGEIYLHAGVITAKSLDSHDWKNVVGNWGKADNRVKMTGAGKNLYRFRFVIKDFFKPAPDTKIRQLTFVFRNADGSLVGKDKHGNDFLIPVFGYIPPVKKKAVYLFDKRTLFGYKLSGNVLDLKTNHGPVQLTAFDDKIIAVKNLPSVKFVRDTSVAVIMHPRSVSTRLEERENLLVWKTDSLRVIIFKNPFFLRFVYHNDTLLSENQGYFERSDNNGLRFELSENEQLYGLGERAVRELRGHRFQLYNQAHYGYEAGAENLNYSVPVLLSSRKYLLLFDNPQKGYADVGFAGKNILELGAIGGVMKYYFVAGYNFKDIYRQYGRLTGTQPLPPRWALGNLQSRMAYRTQQETDSIVGLMQQKHFPIDAIILDFYWFGDSIKGTMGRLKWYKPHWPEPEKMIARFKQKGVKTVLITEPYILDTLENFKIGDSLGIFATDSSGKTYVNHEFYFGNGALIDIFKPIARQWFWDQYQKQIKKGVAGWWGDLGEPESHPPDIFHVNGTADEVHNIYAHYWHKMLFDNYRKYYPQARLFNLNRAGYAGSQRYSVFPWTGDVSRSWGGLQAQLPLMIHMSLSGLPFIHSDAGGFAQGKKDDELYTRWLQMACFSPILRPHGSDIPSEPVFFSDSTQNIVRRFMRERYRLLPYLYTSVWKSHAEGIPLVRPLFFDFPDDSTTYDIFDEYMWGDAMLVAPVVTPGIDSLTLYLPHGPWYDLWTNRIFRGEEYITVAVNLETIPVFVKAGGFIPMVVPRNSTDEYSTGKLTVRYYPDPGHPAASGIIYDDDGKTFGAFEKGLYRKTIIETKNGKSFMFSSEGNGYRGMPEKQEVTFVVVSKYKSKQKSFVWNGKPKKIRVR